MLLIACAAAPSHANRPLTSDTADVVEAGQHQLESFYARTTQRGSPAVGGLTLQVTRGMGWRSQLTLGGSAERGGGDSAGALFVGGKTWLLEVSETEPGLSVAYGLARSRSSGRSWRHDSHGATLVGTLPLGGTLLHANLGWSRDAIARRDSSTWALGVEHPTAQGLTLVAESFGDDRGKPTVSMGVLWQFAERFSVNGSHGINFEKPRVKEWTLGLQIDF